MASKLLTELTQRQCIFIYQVYLHQKVKLTSLKLRTLRKTQPGNKQIVFERWSARLLTPLHPSLAEKERNHKMKSVCKHFHSTTLKESQSLVSYMTRKKIAQRKCVLIGLKKKIFSNNNY